MARAKPQPAVCIYCREERDCSREHVLHDGFGRFRNTLVLNSGVCKVCNQYFGDGIDRILTRETFEGLERYRTGIKKPHKVVDWGKQGLVQHRLNAPAPWGGLLMRFESQEDRVVCIPVSPQLGVHCAATLRWIWITEEDLNDSSYSVPIPLPGARSRLALGSNEADRQRILSLAQTRGLTFRTEGPAKYPYQHQDGVLVQMVETFPIEALRALAKIAFNYLAYTHGPEFMLNPCFDRCRNFIRQGTKPPSPIIRVSNRPILKGDTPQFRRTQGHLLTVGWYPSLRHLAGKVSLFNCLNYSVSLTQAFEGVWQPIRYGHHFDIQTMQARKMVYL